ncbi:sorting nexin-14-like [Leptidea sinapis]|uniref:sorting nexin-14-like n=1 Tax=Leptidea sinapis TaxID=189913 RepID=UPI0021C32924|nr:sorting nexin-14-like [Leptidea sinapis]
MTERCHRTITEKFRSQNFLFCGGIVVAFLAILYVYKFHLITIVLSYGLGCVVCYYGVTTDVLSYCLEQLSCHFIETSQSPEEGKHKGCNTCGINNCDRHDPEISEEPWCGLQIHKQLDQAIEDFYNTILEQYVNSWYTKITLQPFFVDELRYQLRYASALLLRRALKIDYAKLITERLVPCALRHYSVVSTGHKPSIHVAASNRSAELRYLRCLTEAILPYLLRSTETKNPVFKVLIREIFAGWVLLSLTDVLADPYILNMLIILATSKETMAQLPATPNYKVEFLETFVRQSESVYMKRAKLLHIELELLVNEQQHFYAFMQHLKTTYNIHVLQFYKDIKSFQSRILNPELTSQEQANLHREATELYLRYIAVSMPRVELPDAMQLELKELLDAGPDAVKRLQTSRALYQAARQSHAVLEKVLMPRFLHSDEFYKLLIGPRVPTGYQKQMTRRPQDKQRLGARVRNAMRSQTLDGQVLDSNSELSEDSIDNVDILKYLDSLAAEDTLGDQDLSTYKVVLTHVEIRMQPSPRRGPVRVFTLAVHRARPTLTAAFWSLRRTEHDFHLLRAKLTEFHGDRLLAHLPLPSRRDNSPLETLRYKYEDFLQRILQITLLQSSELLYLFLTVDNDFGLVVQASTLNVSPDLGNIYQSVAHKLRKEKGQHLESFLRSFLISSDKERYQALKQGTTRDVEEGVEVNERESNTVMQRVDNSRNYMNTIFENNFDVHPVPQRASASGHTELRGFTHCLMYILLKVVRARGIVACVLGQCLALCGSVVEPAANRLANTWLAELLAERRLAHLVRLGHGVIFGKRSSPRMDAEAQRELARGRLMGRHTSGAALLLGGGVPVALLTAFEVIQSPQLNKQLVYNLLDLCILELFPELQTIDSRERNS